MRPPTLEVPGARFETSPFAYGIASGDPREDGVVLWTALALDVSRSSADIEVGWELAEDEQFGRVVQSGLSTGRAAAGHTLHVEVSRLRPASQYFYRFFVPGQLSATGRTRTLPASGSSPSSLRFGIGCCQDLRGGYFTAHRHAAAEGFDLFFFLGDYIYERNRAGVRSYQSAEPNDLAGYRARYAEFRRDADLQANHAACPWLVTWDDHEVVNDYAGNAHESLPPDEVLRRRTAAYRAYSEWMPLRSRPAADGSLALYRGFSWGDLLDVSVLDTRQHRSGLVCGGITGKSCPERGADSDTLLGVEQREWLFNRLKASPARWNVIAQQVVLTPLVLGNGAFVNHDQWDGYPAERVRLLDVLDALPNRNTVALSGDIHAAGFSRVLRAAGARPSAIEIVTNSISSSGSTGDGKGAIFESLVGSLPGLMYTYADRRGYTACEATPDRWQVDFRTVDSIDTPGGAGSTHASFEVLSDLRARRL